MDHHDIIDLPQETIKCSSCHKNLMNYKVYAPQAQIIHTIIASCPFCGDESFKKEIHGCIFTGPIGLDESRDATIIKEIINNNDHFRFVIEKRI
jgi:coenzyme F420-reducing hydrogenase gamma subunit